MLHYYILHNVHVFHSEIVWYVDNYEPLQLLEAYFALLTVQKRSDCIVKFSSDHSIMFHPNQLQLALFHFVSYFHRIVRSYQTKDNQELSFIYLFSLYYIVTTSVFQLILLLFSTLFLFGIKLAHKLHKLAQHCDLQVKMPML